MSKNLLDLLPEAERKKALERAEKRLYRQRAKKSLDVTPEIFLVGEALYYGDWEMVCAIRRGYTIDPDLDEKTGELTYKKNILTLDEVQVFLEGARKVWYSKLIEQANAGIISNTFHTSSKSFDTAISQFKEKAEVKE